MDSLEASIRGLELVDRKRRQKRWNRTAQVWCREAFTTRSTLNRFWAGKPIRRETFIAICQTVGVDWEDVVAQTHDVPPRVPSRYAPSEMMVSSEMEWNQTVTNDQVPVSGATDNCSLKGEGDEFKTHYSKFQMISNPTLIADRAFDFAVRLVNLCKVLDENLGVGRAFSNQLLRSGTLIGAKVEESQSIQGTVDLLTPLHIALKKARETRYWLKLLIASELIPDYRLLPLLGKTNELIKMIVVIVSPD